jgi:outer membrane protein assembly factor BamB
VITLDTSLLLSLYAAKSGAAAGVGAGGVPAKKPPTAPWAPSAKPAPASQLVQSVLAGRRFVDPSAARLDVKGASDDYRQLFAVYQGLNAMNALAERAAGRGVTEREVARLQTRFAEGLKEVSAYVDGLALENLTLARGESGFSVKAAAGVRKDMTDYVGAVLQVGSKDQAAPALAGEVAFSMTVKRTGRPDLTLDVDLADMGATPRSLTAVVAHLNSRLSATDLKTRFAVEKLPSQPKTITGADGKPIPIGPAPERWALKIVGDSTETVAFEAAARADAVWLAQRVGPAETGARQLLKFQSDVVDTAGPPPTGLDRTNDSYGTDGRIAKSPLDAALTAVRAAAAGADGSVFVLAEVEAAVSGQAIKGERDVALIKYDPAGKLVWTRTLGAAGKANGYALAVAPSGEIAVAGSVKGGLGADAPVAGGDVADSFVALFDADGAEQWTERRAARGEDEARAVAFGADGTVYVAGRSRSAMPLGGVARGGWDGWLQAFEPKAGSLIAEPRGELKFSTQFGTGLDDSADAIAVDGTAILIGGVENGRAVVRRYETGAGQPTLAATRDLGPIRGAITGLAIDGGRLILTGSSTDPNLSAGTVTRVHAGGSDAFVVALDPSLTAGAGDRLTWFGGAGADVGTSAAVVRGEVWVAGRAGGDLPGLPERGDKDGFLVRLDPTTGEVKWGRRFTAEAGEAAPEAIAVARGGASVLDRLGLPRGVIDQTDSKRLIDATALRPGDAFEIRVGAGRAAEVTIEAEDTLDSLARKIERAAGGRARATILTDGDHRKLQVSPRDARADLRLTASDRTLDALEALGLPEILLRGAGVEGKVYALNLSGGLRIDTKEDRKAALDALRVAMSRIRTAYAELATPPDDRRTASGPVPEYMTRQLANYQEALRRLTG